LRCYSSITETEG